MQRGLNSDNVGFLGGAKTGKERRLMQGRLKKWTEHLIKSHFIKLQLGWTFWTITFYAHKSSHRDLSNEGSNFILNPLLKQSKSSGPSISQDVLGLWYPSNLYDPT